MGTRNLTAVMMGGEYKVAQYGQWDGYPSGQGVGILSILRAEGKLEALKDALNKVRFLDAEGIDKELVESYEKNAPQWSSDPDNRTEDQKRWFSCFLTRDLGGKILDNIIDCDDKEIILKNSIAFAGDSLFCEYGYVIDFDKNTFEVFQGFNEKPITEGRFESGDPHLEKEGKYEPIKLIKVYKLDNLPTEEQFLSELEPEEEAA